jgi:CheY-like chemotaxis protein
MKTTIKTVDYKIADQKKLMRFNEPEVEIPNVVHYEIPDMKGYNLLIADHDFFSYEILKYQLQETNATLLHANTGLQTIELINTMKIDFLILDLQLPDLNGFEVLSLVREYNYDFPVIAHTAFAFKKEIERVFTSGFKDVLMKPYSREDLFCLLKKYIT